MNSRHAPLMLCPSLTQGSSIVSILHVSFQRESFLHGVSRKPSCNGFDTVNCCSDPGSSSVHISSAWMLQSSRLCLRSSSLPMNSL